MRTLRNRLRALDRLATPDVWQRAKSLDLGPSSDALPTPARRSSRVVGIVVAFAVFIPAGVFGWRALQPTGATHSPPEDSTVGAILWPERTEAELAATQADADAGDPGVAWRLHPEDVAARFADEVLGWGSPTTPTGDLRYAVAVDPGSSHGVSSAVVTVAQPALPCPSPPPGQPITCPPPYATEELTLRRATTDETAVWTVTAVRALGFGLDLAAGDEIGNGGSISGHVTFPSTTRDTPDVVAQYGFAVGRDGDCSGGSVLGIRPVTDGDISFTASVGEQGWAADGCGADAAGFAFVASASVHSCPKDVLGCPVVVLVPPDLGTNHVPLYGLTAIPMSVSVSPTSTASPGLSGVVTVPDLIGLPLPQARADIEAADLVVGEVQVTTGGYTESVVREQSPAPGEEVGVSTSVDLVTGPGGEDGGLAYGDVLFHGRTNDCSWTLYGRVITGGAGGGLLSVVSPDGPPLEQLLVGTSPSAPPLQLRAFTCHDPEPATLVFGLVSPAAVTTEWVGADGTSGGARSDLDCVASSFPAGFCLVLEDFSGHVDVIARDVAGNEIDRASFG